ncbi:MAG: DedA family protein [Pirellulaceae bacterium]|nr:DedA family protein [Pirellulaceae bacterium]
MILTGAGLPLPEEVAIVAAGVLASVGRLDPWLALAACLVGALIGDCLMYWIGRHFGRRVLREHHWWNRFVKPEREAQVERMLADHGFKVLFLSRFLVGLRSPVYLSAGILRLPFRRFLLYDLFCATIVIGTFFGLSYYFGEAIYCWIRGLEYGATAIVVVAAIVVGIYFWRRHARRIAEDALLAAADDSNSIESADRLEPTHDAEDRKGSSVSAAATDVGAGPAAASRNAGEDERAAHRMAVRGRL